MARRVSAATGHVSVIYFHGMGSQRRYEETSRLIDAIDTWLGRSRNKRDDDRGRLVAIRPRSEQRREADGEEIKLKPGETVTYIDTGYLTPEGGKARPRSKVRFYEVYWAPIMAGSSSARHVAWWIVRQVTRPFKTLFTPWRERQRLRRAALADLFERTDKWPTGATEADFESLLRIYKEFQNLRRVRTYPTGKYAEFLLFLAEEAKSQGLDIDRLKALSDRWFQWYRNVEIRNAFILLTILLALILASGALIWFVLQLLNVASGPSFFGVSELFGGAFKDFFDPTWSNAAGLAISALLTLGLGRFLTEYMGDVEAWATYEETNEKNQRRRRVIEMGVDLIDHVLADPDCKRVVMVSHSLGTTVAHDTVLAVVRKNKATNRRDPITGPIDLTKCRHFVTIASPIDKINYFFESFRSRFHRYTRVVETLRGDIGTPPFSRNKKRYVHWVNYFDEADLIAGGLHSPVSRRSLSHRVDNVHIANLAFPDPGKSHSAYFENRRVISDLFEMIYENKHSYEDLALLPEDGGYDYASATVAPGDKRGGALFYHLIAMAIPWMGVLTLIVHALSRMTGTALLADLTKVLALVALGLLGVLLGSWLFSNKDNRLPL